MRNIVFSLLCLFSVNQVFAVGQCSAVFPDGASTHSPSGTISFEKNAQLFGSDDNILATTTISKNAGSSKNTCDSADCVATGSPSNPATSVSFETTTSTVDVAVAFKGDVVVGSGSFSGNEFNDINPGGSSQASITFSDTHSEYFVNRLVMGSKNTLYLRAGGTYWINQLTLGSQSKIIVEGTGTALIYVNQSLTFLSNSLTNSPSIKKSGDASKLVMYVFADVTLNSNSTFSGSLYTDGDVTLISSSYVFGAVSAANIQLDNNSTITYQNEEIAETDFGEICAIPQQFGFYEFEQEGWSNTGDVLDSSDLANHGNPLGSIAPFLDSPSQKSCQALKIDNNTSSTVINAVDTGIDINSLGNDGTISFWYRSNNAWSGGGNRQLFDASIRSAGDKYFFLVLRSNGSLRFGLEYNGDDDLYSTTSNYSFAANEWVHIAVTWNPLAAELELYVNGNKATTTDSIEVPEGGTLDEMGTLYIGDNSSSYAVNGSTRNSANGYFDDVRVYNFIQNSVQINADLETLSPCDIEPIAYYQFEQENWSAVGDVLDSSTNANNGSPVNTNISSILASDQIACRYLDVPKNTSDAVFDAIDTGVKASTLGNTGTISFWYKSNEDWDAGIARQLADASTRSASNSDPNKHFFLVLTTAGNLEFSLEDKNDRHLTAQTDTSFNFIAGTWVHVAVTWNLPEETVQLVVNGSQQSVAYDNSSGLVDEISDTATLYLGDNRSNYFQYASTGNSADGQFDEFRLYSSEQAVSQIDEDMNDRSGCALVDHYRIEHDSQGFTCEAESIVVKACTNADCDLFDQETTITLSPSGWVGGDTPPAFTGSTNVNLSYTTAETITLGISSASPSAPIKCFQAGVEDSCDITFSNDGFEIYGANIGDPLPDQLAASNFINANLRAVRSNNNVCEPLLEGTQEISLTYDCNTPNQCLTPLNGIPITGDGTGQYTGSINVTFNDQGVASLALLNYPDAGRLSLSVQAVVDGVTISNSDNESVDVYPSYLALSVAQTELVYGDPDVDEQNNYVAGERFTFDIGAYGVNDILLPNYQAEDPQLKVTRVSPNGAGEAGTLKYSGSVLGTRNATTSASAIFSDTSGLNFSGGKHSYPLAYYSEVGRIEIDTRDTDYLGNEILSNGVLTLGDFYPAYFNVALTETPTLADTCSNTFSYLGQSIHFETSPEFTLTAHNALGAITSNYSDTYWNYQPDDDTLEDNLSFIDSSTYAKENSASVIGLGDTPVIASNDNYDGSGTVTINNGHFRYNKVHPEDKSTFAPVSPFDAKINLEFTSDFFNSTFFDKNGNEDTICYQASHSDNTCLGWDINEVIGTQIRYGRLTLESTYGPETEPLNVPIKAEYFDLEQWRINTEDHCTSIAFTQAANQIKLTPIDGYDTDLVGDVESDGQLIMGLPVGDQLTLDAPCDADGQCFQGQLELSLDPAAIGVDWPQHLNYDWNGDGFINTADFPKSTVSFGLFRGNDRIIHWREVFN